MKYPVVCLPGSVAPAAQRYGPLMDTLGPEIQIHLKDLEVYTGDAPAPNYSVELELDAVDRFADSLGINRFHLVGYSGGGFLSIAYAGTRRSQLASLALFEPAMIPGHQTPRESSRSKEFDSKLAGLEGSEFMSAFVGMQVKPNAQLPPPAAPWPGMQKRPAGITAMLRSFAAYEFDRELLRACTFPVYLGYGDQTHEFETVKASVLAEHFADIWVKRYDGVHHFASPAQIYTAAHATSLHELWQRAESQLHAQLALEK